MVPMNQELIELCRQMVSCPSVNPQDKTEYSSPYGEERISRFVFDWLASQGLGPQRQPVKLGRDNVFASAAGADTGRTLLLCAHMDTVDVQSMKGDPFAAEVRDGKLFGRGACDDKGPLAAMMIAFRDRVRAGRLPYNLILLATCGEEYDLEGMRHFVKHVSGFLGGVLIGEPTGLHVIAAHKGVVRLRLRTAGKCVHSSMPEQGKNAIYPLARAVTAVEEFARALRQKRPHAQLGGESLSVTLLKAGQQINIIPDSAEAMLDWRILPGRTAEDCREDLAAFLHPRLDSPVEIDILGEYEPMETDPLHPMVRNVLKVSAPFSGCGDAKSASYATDASALAGLDVPAVVFGPGDAAQAHTDNESIELAQLEQGLTAYGQFLSGSWW